ncbi:unnamed protein product [Protopolystoma xenopodis]|uniref:Uncharacterized protein n=1 Tax=Protopolystoma xenopodis TaxID=117903 RepID=A0A3S5A8X9_9PLAT|nr:unnamed protein product [Protopolystoma xenopodis]
MLTRSDDVRHMTDESLALFHRNRRKLPRKQRQHEYSNKANRQLVKRNPPSPSGGTDLRISSSNTSTLNGSKLNKDESLTCFHWNQRKFFGNRFPKNIPVKSRGIRHPILMGSTFESPSHTLSLEMEMSSAKIRKLLGWQG